MILQPEDAETPRYVYALAAVHARANRLEKALELSLQARDLAVKYQQTDLLRSIDRDLGLLKAKLGK